MKVALLLVPTLFVIQLSSKMHATEPASPGERLERVFDEVSRENRGVDKDYKGLSLQSWEYAQRFAAGGPFVRTSLSLEALVAEISASPGDPHHQQLAEAYVKAAAMWLDDPNPKKRAFAVEFMSIFPLPTLESGVIVKLVPLLGDDTEAWDGMNVIYSQSESVPDAVFPAKVTVGHAAAASLRTITPFKFDDAETFLRWWEANKDLRSHPWYWSTRWRTPCGTADPRAATADLELLATLGPDEGLRMLLLASIRDALLADARRSAGPQLTSVENCVEAGQLELATALFVRKHGLNHKLLDLLEGDIPWPQAEEPAVRHSVLNQVIHVIEHTYTPDDMPRLKQVLAAPQGLVGTNQQLLWMLTRAANRWFPSENESNLVSLLKNDLSRHVLAAELLKATGQTHWQLIKQSYAVSSEHDERDGLIRAVQFAALSRPQKWQCLGELFAMDQLEVIDLEYDTRSARFRSFVKAANSIVNHPLISNAELNDAIYNAGKGSERLSIDAVSANRRAVLEKLRKFFSEPL